MCCLAASFLAQPHPRSHVHTHFLPVWHSGCYQSDEGFTQTCAPLFLFSAQTLEHKCPTPITSDKACNYPNGRRFLISHFTRIVLTLFSPTNASVSTALVYPVCSLWRISCQTSIEKSHSLMMLCNQVKRIYSSACEEHQ